MKPHPLRPQATKAKKIKRLASGKAQLSPKSPRRLGTQKTFRLQSAKTAKLQAQKTEAPRAELPKWRPVSRG